MQAPRQQQTQRSLLRLAPPQATDSTTPANSAHNQDGKPTPGGIKLIPPTVTKQFGINKHEMEPRNHGKKDSADAKSNC
ncbi:hypothetical protein M0R45_010402 [Rubus argutus]|uniref:Uncharacterized protein n=1 Tax=Rubus argutus TaxID=59490 RepID=A0AAW1Y7U1_RUBAR